MPPSEFPRFRDLPKLGNGLRASWGLFGPGDEMGTANWLTSQTVVEAASEIHSGQRINLSLPLTTPDPPMFGRGALRHTIFDVNPEVQDDVIDNFYPQASTQWDGLRHRRDPDLGFYGGIEASEAGPNGKKLGIDVWARNGLIGRGVLIDVKRYCENASISYKATKGQQITPKLLSDALNAQKTARKPGDILLIRTGYIEAYLSAAPEDRQQMRLAPESAGLSPDEEMAEYLWDSQVAALAVDNPAVEVLPRDASRPYLHSRLIPMLGFAMGEFFFFEELSRVSAEDGRFSAFFCSIPLNLPGGVGSPGNAVAIR